MIAFGLGAFCTQDSIFVSGCISFLFLGAITTPCAAGTSGGPWAVSGGGAWRWGSRALRPGGWFCRGCPGAAGPAAGARQSPKSSCSAREHPEKKDAWRIGLLRNFVEFAKDIFRVGEGAYELRNHDGMGFCWGSATLAGFSTGGESWIK